METTVLGLRVLLALACVIGLIWVLARRAGWGKGRRRPAGPAVEVVGRQALGRHAGVAVVAVGNRRLLLGYGEQNVTMLTELAPAPAEAALPLTAEPDSTRTPMTLGDLAAAVLPTQRRRRASAAPVTVAAEVRPASFEDALVAARQDATDADATSATADPVAAPVPAGAAGAAGAAASATAAARAAALAAAALPIGPATLPGRTEPDRTELPAAVGGTLHGSVLAPSTWKQAVAALRERTVRR